LCCITAQAACNHRLGDPPVRLRRLAGVATVPKVDDMFMDTFLMLPTDALAIMDACFTFE
jgi:hypothetical protein